MKDMRHIKSVLKIRPAKAEIRILNALLLAEIFSMQDLTSKSRRELSRLPDLGKKAVQRIEQALWVQKKQLEPDEVVIARSTGLPDRRFGHRSQSASGFKQPPIDQ